MNVTSVRTTDYENQWLHGPPKNKPNSNPIQTQSKPISKRPKMNVTSVNTSDYGNKRLFALRQNKPNSNPIKPNFKGKITAQNQKDTIKYTFSAIPCVLFDPFTTRQDGLFSTLSADYKKPPENKLLLPTPVENDIILKLDVVY